jgi:hypothetical protein
VVGFGSFRWFGLTASLFVKKFLKIKFLTADLKALPTLFTSEGTSAEKTQFLASTFQICPLRCVHLLFTVAKTSISAIITFSSLNFRVQYLLNFQIKFRVYRAFVLSNH